MSTVEFIFDERKAAQAAAHLLRRHGSSMPYTKLIKLLYLADRQSLIETGYTITGDQLVAMADGPALNRVLFFIEAPCRGVHCRWCQHATHATDGQISDVGDPAEGEMSPYERDVLDGVCDTYGPYESQALIESTMGLPEWSTPNDRSRRIDPRDILKAGGYSDGQIESVVEDVAAHRRFHDHYGGE